MRVVMIVEVSNDGDTWAEHHRVEILEEESTRPGCAALIEAGASPVAYDASVWRFARYRRAVGKEEGR